MAASWSLDWSHGRTTVHAGAGAIGRTDFRLADGRTVNPFHEAPWVARGESAEPAVLGNLRGDWPCLPFGHPYATAEGLSEPWAGIAGDGSGPPGLAACDRMLHGYGGNTDWGLVSLTDAALMVGVDYPEESWIRRITRTVRPVPGMAAIDVSAEILPRRSCALPFGFHPNFALRGAPGSFRIEPSAFAFGYTHPSTDGVTNAKVGARFTSLAAVPLGAGGIGRFDCLPFAEDCEEIIQLCGLHDGLRLVDEDAQVAWTLSWDTARIPSVLLWMSNRGRKFAPWRGENLCLGVEPVASAFDLGPMVAASQNPIVAAGVRTAIEFQAGVVTSLGYRLSAEAVA